MALIKLKPWPFEDRIVKLHWFGHVRLTSANRWRITVAFEDQQKITLVQYPIGLLPILKIGQYYKNGQTLMYRKAGTIGIVQVKDLSDGYTTNSLDVCRRVNYYLYGNAELINQKVWCFQSNGTRYYIPHIELVRALFAKNKVLANALLRPNGLFYLLEYYYFNDWYAEFDFSREISASIIGDDFVQHFSWLYLVPKIRNSFESIQTNAYARAMASNYGLAKGQAIDLTIPKLFNLEWTFSGKRFGQHVLIYELLAFTGVELPVDRIYYSHPSIKKRVYTDNPKKKQVSVQTREQTLEIDNKDNNQAKEDINQPVVVSEATQVTFIHNPEIRRIVKYEQQVNQGDSYTSKQGKGGATFTVVSVDESIAGGNIQPVEFKTLDVTCERDGFGLEDFYEMIKCLEQMHSELIISMNLVNLPPGRKFSWLPDGRRRVCAIVRIGRAGKRTDYIMEVARPDQRSLSTLIVQFPGAENREDEEKVIHRLLLSLVFNNGNWPTEWLKEINHVKLRHTSKDPYHWAARVYDKLI